MSTTTEERRVLRALIGRRMPRRRAVRRAVVAELLRNRGEQGEGEGAEDEDDDEDTRLVKALIASRMLVDWFWRICAGAIMRPTTMMAPTSCAC